MVWRTKIMGSETPWHQFPPPSGAAMWFHRLREPHPLDQISLLRINDLWCCWWWKLPFGYSGEGALMSNWSKDPDRRMRFPWRRSTTSAGMENQTTWLIKCRKNLMQIFWRPCVEWWMEAEIGVGPNRPPRSDLHFTLGRRFGWAPKAIKEFEYRLSNEHARWQKALTLPDPIMIVGAKWSDICQQVGWQLTRGIKILTSFEQIPVVSENIMWWVIKLLKYCFSYILSMVLCLLSKSPPLVEFWRGRRLGWSKADACTPKVLSFVSLGAPDGLVHGYRSLQGC